MSVCKQTTESNDRRIATFADNARKRRGFDQLVTVMRLVRENCRSIHETEQSTGATFAELIDAALEDAGVSR